MRRQKPLGHNPKFLILHNGCASLLLLFHLASRTMISQVQHQSNTPTGHFNIAEKSNKKPNNVLAANLAYRGVNRNISDESWGLVDDMNWADEIFYESESEKSTLNKPSVKPSVTKVRADELDLFSEVDSEIESKLTSKNVGKKKKNKSKTSKKSKEVRQQSSLDEEKSLEDMKKDRRSSRKSSGSAELNTGDRKLSLSNENSSQKEQSASVRGGKGIDSRSRREDSDKKQREKSEMDRSQRRSRRAIRDSETPAIRDRSISISRRRRHYDHAVDQDHEVEKEQTLTDVDDGIENMFKKAHEDEKNRILDTSRRGEIRASSRRRSEIEGQQRRVEDIPIQDELQREAQQTKDSGFLPKAMRVTGSLRDQVTKSNKAERFRSISTETTTNVARTYQGGSSRRKSLDELLGFQAKEGHHLSSSASVQDYSTSDDNHRSRRLSSNASLPGDVKESAKQTRGTEPGRPNYQTSSRRPVTKRGNEWGSTVDGILGGRRVSRMPPPSPSSYRSQLSSIMGSPKQQQKLVISSMKYSPTKRSPTNSLAKPTINLIDDLDSPLPEGEKRKVASKRRIFGK